MYLVAARIVVTVVRYTIGTCFSITYASDTTPIYRIGLLHAALPAPRLFDGPSAMLSFRLAFARAPDMMRGALIVLALLELTLGAVDLGRDETFDCNPLDRTLDELFNRAQQLYFFRVDE
jgi:hypothetical protein